MKKSFFETLVVLLTAMIMCSTTSISVAATSSTSADIVVPCYEIAQSPSSILSLSGTTASCTSRVTGTDAVKVSAVQTLEKHSGWFWIWNEVEGANWSKTVNSSLFAMSNTKSGLDSGTYRLKTVFTLTESDGTTETITVYSTEKTI